MGKFKRFLKRNWDLTLVYLTIVVTFLTVAWIFATCGGGWGCLVAFMPIVVGSQIVAFILLPISIWRTIRRKDLSKLRIIYIAIPMVIGLFFIFQNPIVIRFLNPTLAINMFPGVNVGPSPFSITDLGQVAQNPEPPLEVIDILSKDPILNQSLESLLPK